MTTEKPHAAFKALKASSNDTAAADHHAALAIIYLDAAINNLSDQLRSTRLTMLENEKQLNLVRDHLKVDHHPSL